MKIQFYLRFHTEVGQSLGITHNGDLPADGNGGVLAMTYLNGDFWQGNLEIKHKHKDGFIYQYFLRNKDGEIVREWGRDRVVEFS